MFVLQVNAENVAQNKRQEFQLDDNCRFIRKGETGGWKKVMSEEYIKKFDDWTRDKLQDTDFPVPS